MYKPRGYKEIKATRFHENRHKKLVSFPTLRNCSIYTPGDIPANQFYYRLRRPQDQCVARTYMLRKISNDSIGNKNRDVSAEAQRFIKLRHSMPLVINSVISEFCSFLFFSKFWQLFKFLYSGLCVRNDFLLQCDVHTVAQTLYLANYFICNLGSNYKLTTYLILTNEA